MVYKYLHLNLNRGPWAMGHDSTIWTRRMQRVDVWSTTGYCLLCTM